MKPNEFEDDPILLCIIDGFAIAIGILIFILLLAWMGLRDAEDKLRVKDDQARITCLRVHAGSPQYCAQVVVARVP